MPTNVHYRVTVLPEQHELEVLLTLDGLPAGPVRLDVPTWVLGAYAQLRYARDVFDVRAVDARGHALGVTRQAPSGVVVAREEGPLRVAYRTWMWDPAWGELAGFVAHDQAMLLATRQLFVASHEGPVTVDYVLPDKWPVHHPAGAWPIGHRSWEYPSFAAWMDTPVVAGRFETRSRDVDGTVFHFVFLDRTHGFDTELEPFLDALVAGCRAAREVFGSFPFDGYSFVITFDPSAHWGLEHAFSTTVAFDPLVFIDAAKRWDALRVCTHELVHAWNVCRLKPAPLGKTELVSAPQPDALWVSEGFTRWYELLLGVRAKQVPAARLFSNVLNYFRHLTSWPAYRRTSATDSSRATFLNHHRYPGAANTMVDYYDLGLLVAFDLDATLRLAGASLDAEFRAFYEANAGRGDGFTTRQLGEFLEARHPGTGMLVQREAEWPAGLTTLELLGRLGFGVARAEVPFLGLILDRNEGPLVTQVLDDAPAGRCGLAPGDELVSLDGLAFRPGVLAWLVKHRPAVTLGVKRGQRLLEFEIPVGHREDVSRLFWSGDAAQLARLRAWVGPFDPADGETIALDHYDNFHGTAKVL